MKPSATQHSPKLTSRACAFCGKQSGAITAYNNLSLNAVGGNGGSYAHPKCFARAAEKADRA